MSAELQSVLASCRVFLAEFAAAGNVHAPRLVKRIDSLLKPPARSSELWTPEVGAVLAHLMKTETDTIIPPKMAQRLANDLLKIRTALSDTERLNWLERMVVEVRAPLQWGSRQLFIANPEEVEGMDDDPSDIRAQIDFQRGGA